MNEGSAAPRIGKELGGDDFLKYVTERLKSIQYGSVEITVFNGKVVQVETTEKRRFDAQGIKK